MYLFQEEEIKKHISINKEIMDLIEAGFSKLANKEVTLPPIMRMDIPESCGEVDVKSAYIKGQDSFAIKISSGFFKNDLYGLPSLSGMMLVFSSKTGMIESILLDNGYLTDVRTAAAGAVAAKYLAKENVDRVGVIGTGMQARVQMEALFQVKPFKQLTVFGRTVEHVQRYAEEMQKKLGVAVVVAKRVENVVKENELVVTTTPATTPLIKADWLHPGLHITAMGSDAEHKQEIDVNAFNRADIVCCDVADQAFRLGELHHALNNGILTKDDKRIVELGDIITGKRQGRVNEQQITISDLTGTGVQDTVCARYALSRLKIEKIGMK